MLGRQRPKDVFDLIFSLLISKSKGEMIIWLRRPLESVHPFALIQALRARRFAPLHIELDTRSPEV